MCVVWSRGGSTEEKTGGRAAGGRDCGRNVKFLFDSDQWVRNEDISGTEHVRGSRDEARVDTVDRCRQETERKRQRGDFGGVVKGA